MTGSASFKREECYGCKKPVFLAEKILVGSPIQMRHRTCFRCDRCTTQLTLANYYVTEKGQFCCETCPDEEKPFDTFKNESSTSDSDSDDSSDSEESKCTSISTTEGSVASSKDLSTKHRTIFLNDKSDVSMSHTNLDDNKENLTTQENVKSSPAISSKSSQSLSVKSSPAISAKSSSSVSIKSSPAISLKSAQSTQKNPIVRTSSNISERLKYFESKAVESKLSLSSRSSSASETHSENEQTHKTLNSSKSTQSFSENISHTLDSNATINISNDGTQNMNNSTSKFIDSTIEHDVRSSDYITKPLINNESNEINKDIDEKEPCSHPQDATICSHNEEKSLKKLYTTEYQNSAEISSKMEESENKIFEKSEIEEKHTTTEIKDYREEIEDEEYPDDLNPFGYDDESSSKKDDESSTKKDDELSSKKDDELSSKKDDESSSKKDDESKSLNPFGSDDEDEKEDIKCSDKKNFNPFWSDDEDYLHDLPKSKQPPPRPPPPTLKRNEITQSTLSAHFVKGQSPSPSVTPTGCRTPDQSTLRLKKKQKPAPTPPSAQLIKRVNPVNEESDTVLKSKLEKDMKNHSNKLTSSNEDSLRNRSVKTPKIEKGEWKRRKGPAPSRPVPQKRVIRKLPFKHIQQELTDIEVKQLELERQGVLLETLIRSKTEKPPDDTGQKSPSNRMPSPSTKRPESQSSESDVDKMSVISSNASHPGVEVEDLILQLFELVNEKNELFRRQTELMYLKREKRLEEEHAELEYQIRCLLMKHDKTPEETHLEEELIARLMKNVEQRDQVVNCLEMERQREAVEDESIATHMIKYQEKYLEGIDSNEEAESKKKKNKKKKLRLLKKKKKKDTSKDDADKDVDETEVKKEKQKKKKWFKKESHKT